VDLHPERGSLAQREEARRHNAALRTNIEEVIFPQVIALEEEKRGPIDLSDDFRSRIQKAAAGNGRAESR
jgi:hypothetical protein